MSAGSREKVWLVPARKVTRACKHVEADMDFELLITEVEKRPAIWDPNDPKHCNRDVATQCWHEVAELMQLEVDAVKKKWKSLRDNFRIEMKKVPPENSADPALPMEQYLSKWPYFKMLFFLRDPMMGRRISTNHSKAPSCAPAFKNSEKDSASAICCFTAPSLRSRSDNAELTTSNEFSSTVGFATSAPGPSSQAGGSGDKRKKERNDLDYETLTIDREKVAIKRQKLQLRVKDNERRERDENDADRHFLLSLLPLMRMIPEQNKASARIQIQEILYEVAFQHYENFSSGDPQTGPGRPESYTP